MQILWNVGIRLESSCLQGNAQISSFVKNCVIICLLWKINHKFAVGSQPTAVCGAEAEARNAAAEM